MDRPVTTKNGAVCTPIEMATDEIVSRDMECVVSGIKKRPNGRTALIYWNKVNVSKQASDKLEWHWQNTLCYSNVSLLQSVSIHFFHFKFLSTGRPRRHAKCRGQCLGGFLQSILFEWLFYRSSLFLNLPLRIFICKQ